jgi:hypothetical protein
VHELEGSLTVGPRRRSLLSLKSVHGEKICGSLNDINRSVANRFVQRFENAEHKSGNIIYVQHSLAVRRWFCCDIPSDYNNGESSASAVDHNNGASTRTTAHD